MANAGFGLPYVYTIPSDSGSFARPTSNVMNDEPGLVVSKNLANNASFYIDINLDVASSDISFFAILGVNINFDTVLHAFTSSANRTAGTSPEVLMAGGSLSSNRTGLRRKLTVFAPNSKKYLRLYISNQSGVTADLEFWRVLVGKWISPADQIEVGAQAKIDDRQNRRYGQNGRRNFSNNGVYPAFTGQWPWISDTEYKTMIKPMMLKYGASIPVLFCLNYEDTVYGEDDLYYGDLEKDQAIGLDDGQLYSYGFSIVDIAPVA